MAASEWPKMKSAQSILENDLIAWLRYALCRILVTFCVLVPSVTTSG